MFNNKVLMITGGTGSFGNTVLKRFLSTDVREIRIFSRDEKKQEEMRIALNNPKLKFYIGDVRNYASIYQAMKGVDYVFHAAALKHVPAAEYNPFECIRTNVHGAENVVVASIRAGVKRVIALSTDKAANPINLYGASKLASDKIFVAANHLSGGEGPHFSVVRYGNVVGSRGSIVPLFRRLIAEGADALPITDPRMTRFWITIPQGVNFVLSSMVRMTGGEIFIPKIPSAKVADVIRVLAPEMPQKVVGIRPGEKLHEVMITEDDAFNTIELPDRYVITPTLSFWRTGTYLDGEGRKVEDGFRYSSDKNPVWLDDDDLRALLQGV